MAIYCEYAASAWLLPLSTRRLRSLLHAMSEAAVDSLPVELHLVDDAAIAHMNDQHMGAIGPTNILSFPGDELLPGTLVLSLDTYRRECIIYGQDEKIHLLRLLAHGMAHLLGLDHGDAMAAIENKCLRAALDALNHKERR